MTAPLPLTFAAVDGLGFAAASGRLTEQTTQYIPTSLGPLLELLCLTAGGRLPSPAGRGWLLDNGAGPMLAALHNNNEECWTKPDDQRIGFIRTARNTHDGDVLLTKFLMDLQRAARNVTRLPGMTPGQLAAAMQELESNIQEHSEAPSTGLLAFRAAPDAFELVVTDRGIGILKSLQRCAVFADLHDHGKAIQAALSDGTSRFGSDSGRGHGFRPIFLGLANLHAALRFRSGDHALVVDGTGPSLATAQLAQKPVIDGFLASIRCEVPPAKFLQQSS